jgi:predicted dehydrogenase
MGRVRCAANFVRTLQGKEEPLSTPQEAISLMKIIDAVYKSSRTNKPVRVN